MEVIVLPYHGQGHMNTMLQFAKRFAWKATAKSPDTTIHITIATTLSTTRKTTKSITDMITLESIYDDTDDAQLHFMARMEKFRPHASQELSRLITTSKKSTTKCLLVYDFDLPWAVDVAKEHDILAAAFVTQACANVASYFPLFLEVYSEDETHPVIAAANANAIPTLTLQVPSPEELQLGLPNIIPLSSGSGSGSGSGTKSIHPILRMVLSHMYNLHLADWVLFNSFDHLEDQVVKWMTNMWPVRTIGPTLPSAYLDKRVEYDVDYGFNLYKSNNESCMNWLNTKEAGTVVYVSFGSAAGLSAEQIVEIAEALKQTHGSFLWVVRETEQVKLPDNFIDETSNKGLVVSWCPQLNVLQHDAVGCFVTHCGWNSTMEALSFGVPMLAMPQFMDQMVDSHFVDQVWDVGIRLKENDNKLVTCEEIKRCLLEIMQGQRAEVIKENASKWKALAKEAVCEGGSSDKHIAEIIDRLASS